MKIHKELVKIHMFEVQKSCLHMARFYSLAKINLIVEFHQCEHDLKVFGNAFTL